MILKGLLRSVNFQFPSVTMYKVGKCMISRVFKLSVFLLINLKLICSKKLCLQTQGPFTQNAILLLKT